MMCNFKYDMDDDLSFFIESLMQLCLSSLSNDIYSQNSLFEPKTFLFEQSYHSVYLYECINALFLNVTYLSALLINYTSLKI